VDFYPARRLEPFKVPLFLEAEVIEASWYGMYIHNLFRRANAIRRGPAVIRTGALIL